MKILSKPFFIGLATTIGAVSALYAIYFGFYPNVPDMQRKDDIIGTWRSFDSYADQGIIVSSKLKTSYFSNGKYNVSGEMSEPIKSIMIICSYPIELTVQANGRSMIKS